MSDTNSWNYHGNTGALAVKSKYAQPDPPVAPVLNNPQPTAPDNVPDAGGTTTGSAPTDAPQEAPVDTNN
jgi:hypothetical protein